VKQLLSYVGVSAVLVVGAAWGVTLLYPQSGVAKAVWASAAIALATQVVAYAVARQFVAANPTAAWGIGSLIRFGVLILYAFVGVGALGLSSGPALFSLAGFLFVTMVIEPLFLKNSN
jgi:hypothetical protein